MGALALSGVLVSACVGEKFTTATRNDDGVGGVAGAHASAGTSGANASLYPGNTNGRAGAGGDATSDDNDQARGRAGAGAGNTNAEPPADAGRAGTGTQAAGASDLDAAGAGGNGTGDPAAGGSAGSSHVARAGAAGHEGAGGSSGAGGADDAGGAADTGGASAGAGPSGDHTPPEVVSVEPEPDAKGVAADAVVRVTFSEPMNIMDFQDALDTSELANDVFIKWNGDSTIVTLEPTSGLPYASGTALDDTQALRFDFVIGTGARDLAGNPLETPFESGFWTLRRIAEELRWADADQVTHDAETDYYYVTLCEQMTEAFIPIAPTPNLSRAYVAFRLVPFLATTAEPGFLIELAELHGRQFASDPAAVQATYDEYGPLLVDELPYENTTPSVLDVAGTNLGEFCASADVIAPRLDITESFRQDVSDGVEKLLYAVRFSWDTNEVSGTSFVSTSLVCDSLGLDVTYVIE